MTENEEVGQNADGAPKRSSRAYAWIFDVCVVALMFARGLFVKEPPAGTGVPANDPENRVVPERTAAAPAPVEAPEKTGRASDREELTDADFLKRGKWGTPFVVCAFGMALAGGAGFLFFYWTKGSNLLLGAALALFLGGLGLALVLASHLLIRRTQATEPREVLPSNPAEREAAVEAFCSGAHDIRRRGLLKGMTAAAMAFFAAMVVSLLKSLGLPPLSSLFTTVWKSGQRLMTMEGKPVTIQSLQPGSSIVVFPEDSVGSEKTQTVLIRVQESLLQLPRDRAHWAPMGYVAYSRVCTHAGCTVGLFESETNLLLCPCHQSTFDILRSARPTSGPAARPLPQLPLYADSEGNLRAGGGFTAPPGPGFTGMPL